MKHDLMLHRMEKALRLGGDLYALEDITSAINNGLMQGFVRNDTWVVTQVHDYPRRRVLNILLLVGELDDAKALEPEIVKFAKDVGATRIQAQGRFGWETFATKYGWEKSSQVYHKDIEL